MKNQARKSANVKNDVCPVGGRQGDSRKPGDNAFGARQVDLHAQSGKNRTPSAYNRFFTKN
jgi:hypothetical protein